MPQIALLSIASPMLLAAGPLDGTTDTAVLSPEAAEISTAADLPVEPLRLSWSLADVQDNPQQSPPPEGEAPPEDDMIVVKGMQGPPDGDPAIEFNETSYRIVQDIDSALVGPAAYAYRDGLPEPIRDGLGNVVRNLREPVNFLNFLLQFKIGDALETFARFAINSTVGLAGLFDVAGSESIGLPYRRNGFANTLGYYGVDTGAYLYLPIAGATTVRDFIGDTLDQAVLPIFVGSPFNTIEYAAPYFVISNLDSRLSLDEELARIGETGDPYAARRDTYLYYRARDISELRGQPAPEPPAILREMETSGDADPKPGSDDDTPLPEPDGR